MKTKTNRDRGSRAGRPSSLTLLALIALAFFFAGNARVQSEIVVSFTNHVWRYNQTGQDLSVFPWETRDYDDSSWPEGRGVFAFENNLIINQYTNTVLSLTYPGNTSQTITYYFRTHFTITNDPMKVVLTSSNFIDDGCVFYINGVEAGRYYMRTQTGRPTGTDLAYAGAPMGEGIYFVIPLSRQSLVQGDNLLAVEVHQNSPTSSDIVWGCALHVAVGYAPILHQSPASTNVLQGRSATLRVVAEGGPPPTYQWYRNFEYIPDATNDTFTIAAMKLSDEGSYHVTVANPYGAVDTEPVQVTMVPDTNGPVLVNVFGLPWQRDSVLLQFDESLQGAVDAALYQVNFASGTPNPPSVLSAQYNASSNHVTLIVEPPLDLSGNYVLSILSNGAISDYFGNVMPNVVNRPIVFPTIGIQLRPDRNVMLEWTPGLQPYQAQQVHGPWLPFSSTNPATFLPTGTNRFYRLRP